MKSILLIRVWLIVIFMLLVTVGFGDSIFVTSRTDSRLLAYRDSMTAYATGKSVCENLTKLFQKLTNSNDYDSYFLDPWLKSFSPGEPVDTLLGYSEVLPYSDFPDTLSGNQFNSSSEIGQMITYQFRRLDTLRVKPCAQVVGAELPTLYLYAKPSHVIIYKNLDRCWEKKMKYTTLDIVTHFICDELKKTRVPYNILRYYENNKLVQMDWIDPISQTLIRTFSFR